MIPGHRIQQQIRLLHLKTQAATGKIPPILQMAASLKTKQQT
jgi:hypothetical protein